LSQQSKNRLAGLYGTDVSAQLKALGLTSGQVMAPGLNKDATSMAREYKPTTPIELRALAKLKAARHNSFREKEFHRLVLRHLATIQDLGKRPPRKKYSRRTQDLRRQVRRVHTAIRRLVDAESDLQSRAEIPRLPSFHLVEAVRSLSCYSERLEIEFLSATSARRQFRHNVSPQNLEILEMVKLVHMVTGEPHWENLAILLKGAMGDSGMNSRRLFQLYKDRENKRVRTLGLFRRARLQAEVGKLRLL
jgi:hypothetical protein